MYKRVNNRTKVGNLLASLKTYQSTPTCHTEWTSHLRWYLDINEIIIKKKKYVQNQYK